MKNQILYKLSLFILFLGGALTAKATHLRAANIEAERIGTTTYKFTLSIYTDIENVADSTLGISNPVNMSGVIVVINGVEDSVYRTQPPKYIGNQTFENIYEFTYDFGTSGNYVVSYKGINRNDFIENINNSNSVDVRMWVSTFVNINAGDPNFNTAPLLLNPPIDRATTGQVYTHNPGAYDVDGDSLSYKLLVPQSGAGQEVPNYKYPDDPSFGGSSSLTLDPLTGDLVWDAPVKPGEYNVAFMIEEWRDGVRIGFIIRDMQIIVEEGDNQRPNLIIPKDTCISTEELFTAEIIAYDPDGDDISLTSFGEVYEEANTGLFTTSAVTNDSIIGTFEWSPSCDNVRISPYNVVFKVVDDPSSDQKSLSTLETWQINVIAKAPQNLVAAEENGKVELSWDKYNCDNASFISIYRIECDTGNIVRSSCLSGVPGEWGYTKIADVSVNDTTFIDNSINSGSDYCYLIFATFSAPANGESYASNRACVSTLEGFVPILNVEVTTTNETNGVVSIQIGAPIDLPISSNGPYDVSIFNTNKSITIPIHQYSVNTIKDTTLTDNIINTSNELQNYQLLITEGIDTLSILNFTQTLLTATSAHQTIELVWEEQQPWNNSDTLFQYVFADTGSGYFLLDSVVGGTNTYSVTQFGVGDTVCSYIETNGVYCIQDTIVTVSTISNESCAVVIDTIPPCAPVLEVLNVDCPDVPLANEILINNLLWSFDNVENCDTNDVVGYRLYELNDNNDTLLLASIEGDSIKVYDDDSLLSKTKCYRVTAVDEFGIESKLSNIACGDNCEYFELPNVFTPQGDGVNELFIPMPTPLFVESVQVEIYNRWGKLVFSKSNDPNINWNGKGLDGKPVTEGNYYYRAEVRFDKLLPKDQVKIYKGWLMILR